MRPPAPGALPVILTGLRIGFFVCFAAVLGGETLSAVSGLGHQVASAAQLMDSARMFAWILVVIAISFGLVALAGFMRIQSPWFPARWKDRIINIHPSLLPAFPGLRVQQQAIEAGSRISGCTVHFVTADLDAGPIIAQAAVPVLSDDSEATLSARILRQEHRLYPLVVRWFGEGRVSLSDAKVAVAGLPDGATLLFSPAP